ncbi:unnamed protein product [Polarella glacialis]|uniref:Uncharacterized protein n=1 Tax=Polarella glacialis TaxID=89957 RepID=A0A813J7Z3_POLGL|nr:unnamed protein product [Polarella glacialis]
MEEAWVALPPSLARRLRHAGFGPGEPEVLAQACDVDGGDQASFMVQLGFVEDDVVEFNKAYDGLAVVLTIAESKAALKRKRRSLLHQSYKTMVVEEVGRQAEALRLSSLLARVRVPRSTTGVVGAKWVCKRTSRLHAEVDPNRRAAIELEEKVRLAAEVIKIIKDAKLPIVLAAEMAMDPDRALASCAGRARARTIRKRVREFWKLRGWLLKVHAVLWPQHAGHLVDYLLDRGDEPCARTVPGSVVSAVRFLERCGDVGAESAVADDRLVTAVLQDLTIQLSVGAPATRKAAMYLVVMVLALEFYVVDETNAVYTRVFAWVKLIKLWCSLRHDDCLGVRPELLRLLPRGLEGQLERTKTSGPGRRIRWLPFFVSADATLAGVPWLAVGFELMGQGSFCFARDYLLPMPMESLQGAVAKPVDWAAATAMSRALLVDLKEVDRKEGTWVTVPDSPLFLNKFAATLHSEHSERNWLPSLAALEDVPKIQRDCLGRWMPDASDDYARTARQVVYGIQKLIVKKFQTNPVGLDEDTGKAEMEAYLDKKGLGSLEVKRVMKKLDVKAMLAGDSIVAAPAGQLDPVDALLDNDGFGPASVGSLLGAEAPRARTKYFITYTAKRKISRLHLTGGCHRVPGLDVKDYEFVDDKDQLEWNAFCHSCWRQGRTPEEEDREAILATGGLASELPEQGGDVSSTDESSSTAEDA